MTSCRTLTKCFSHAMSIFRWGADFILVGCTDKEMRLPPVNGSYGYDRFQRAILWKMFRRFICQKGLCANFSLSTNLSTGKIDALFYQLASRALFGECGFGIFP